MATWRKRTLKIGQRRKPPILLAASAVPHAEAGCNKHCCISSSALLSSIHCHRHFHTFKYKSVKHGNIFYTVLVNWLRVDVGTACGKIIFPLNSGTSLHAISTTNNRKKLSWTHKVALMRCHCHLSPRGNNFVHHSETDALAFAHQLALWLKFRKREKQGQKRADWSPKFTTPANSWLFFSLQHTLCIYQWGPFSSERQEDMQTTLDWRHLIC